MKNLNKILFFCLAVLLTSSIQAADEIKLEPAVAKKYDEKFSQVSTRRQGLDSNSIDSLKNPVIRDVEQLPSYSEPIIVPQEVARVEPEVVKVEEPVYQEPVYQEPVYQEPVYQEPVKEYVSYTVSGVVGNKAKINGTWYSIGDKIGEEYLRSVSTKSIFLASKDNKDQREIKVERGLPNAKVIKK